jgi:hypothetical protein
MATACSDRFVRIYDRRRLTMCNPNTGQPTASLLSLAPLHLLGGTPRNPACVYATRARFSNRGDRVVATYHREQVRWPLGLLNDISAIISLCFSFLLVRGAGMAKPCEPWHVAVLATACRRPSSDHALRCAQIVLGQTDSWHWPALSCLRSP